MATNNSINLKAQGVPYYDGAGTFTAANTATAGQMLQSGANTTPTWSTATYPATAGSSGNILTSDGTNIVSSSMINVNTDGVTIPTQPAFLAYLDATQSNKSGTGTLYTLGTNALTEVFDQGNDFVTSGTFTAPVTGKYQLSVGMTWVGCTIATSGSAVISTSNRSYQFTNSRPAGTSDINITGSCLCDMDAADTAIVQVYSTGEAGDTDDVLGQAAVETFFSGYLAC